MRPEGLCPIRQQAWCLIAGRLHHPTVATHQRLLHELLPGVLLTGWGRLLPEDGVTLGV